MSVVTVGHISMDEIASCNDADALLASLKQCATDILGNLERMAAILKRLDELGVQISVDHALIPYIRMIANGELTASCLVACSADPKLLDKAIKLPRAAQEQIARDEPFWILDPNGRSRSVRPSQMTPRDMSQVFKKSGGVRTTTEQKSWLNGSANRSAATKEQHKRFKGHSKGYQESGNLPKVAGESVEGSTRCPTCRAKMLPGAECLSCKLSNKTERGVLDSDERKRLKYGQTTGEAADGWKERLATVRAAKQSGDELGFHVDWLIRYCEKPVEDEDVEKLSALFSVLQRQLNAA